MSVYVHCEVSRDERTGTSVTLGEQVASVSRDLKSKASLPVLRKTMSTASGGFNQLDAEAMQRGRDQASNLMSVRSE